VKKRTRAELKKSPRNPRKFESTLSSSEVRGNIKEEEGGHPN